MDVRGSALYVNALRASDLRWSRGSLFRHTSHDQHTGTAEFYWVALWGSDSAFHVIWSRFRQLRRHLPAG